MNRYTFSIMSFLASFGCYAENKEELVLAKQQIALLKAQLETIQQFHDVLISTVHWTLGTVITVAVFLIGYSWFSNFKSYERDKASLRSELSSMVQIDLEHAKAEFNLNAERLNTSVNELLDEKLTLVTNEFRGSIERLRNSTERDVLRIQLEQDEIERQSWINRKVHVNALRKSKAMLSKSILLGDQYTLSRALDMCNEDLKALLQGESAVYPDAEAISSLVEVIGKVPPAHGVLIETIKERISKIASRS